MNGFLRVLPWPDPVYVFIPRNAGGAKGGNGVIAVFCRFILTNMDCRERGYKKSTLLARLIRQYLDLEGFNVSREGALNRFGRPTQR